MFHSVLRLHSCETPDRKAFDTRSDLICPLP